MGSVTGAAAPVREEARLKALDVLRGLAVCGILLLNMFVMGDTFLSMRPLTPFDAASPNWIVWIVSELFVEGTQRGLFGMLFGAGLLLMTLRADGQDKPGAFGVWYRRAFLLMALGAVQFSVLLWPGEILFIYGVMALVLYPFRKLGPKLLLTLSAALTAVTILMAAMFSQEPLQVWQAGAPAAARAEAGQTLTPAEDKLLAARQAIVADARPTPQALQAETAARTGDYPTLVRWSLQQWVGLWAELGPVIGFDCLSAMFLGMALFKWRVLTGERSLGFYVAMAVIGYALGVGVNAWEVWTRVSLDFSPQSWPAEATYNLGRLLTAVGHIGLVLALFKADALGVVGRALQNLGRMALTNYVGQTLIYIGLFYGLGLYGRFNWAELWGIAAVVWVVQAILSGWWLKLFAMGPLEWLLRAGAYGRLPPLLRSRVPAQAPAQP